MEINFLETIKQIFESMIQLEINTILSIIIAMTTIIVVLNIFSKISKIIQIGLAVGLIMLVIMWFLFRYVNTM